MPDNISFDKAQQEWERLQKALKKDPQNPTLLKDLYRLYVFVEKTYWENHEKISSSPQTKKEVKKFQKLEKFFLDIVKKSGLDTDTVHRNLAKEQIKTLQGLLEKYPRLLEKYPHNAFLHSTLQATIDGLDPWINDSLGTSRETLSEDQLTRRTRRTTLWQYLPNFLTPKAQLQKQEQTIAAWEIHHNNKWKSLKKETEDWLTELKSKHDSELHFMKIGWQLQKELASQATDPVIRYWLSKDLEDFKSHVKTIYEEHQIPSREFIASQFMRKLTQYKSDIKSIQENYAVQAIDHSTTTSSNRSSRDLSYHQVITELSRVLGSFYNFGRHTWIPEECNPWGEKPINTNILNAYEATIKKHRWDSLEQFLSRIDYFCDKFIEFRKPYSGAISYLNQNPPLNKDNSDPYARTNKYIFWDKEKREYRFKDPDFSLNPLIKNLDAKFESFLLDTKANIDYLTGQSKKIASWNEFLRKVKNDWTAKFGLDPLLPPQEAKDKATYKDKREGVKQLSSEAFNLHQLREKYEILRLLREQDPYNTAWHEEIEKTITEIETVTQSMSSETIKKKIIEAEAAIKGMSEKKKTRGQIITRRSSYIKSPLLQAQLKEGDKIATAKATLQQLKLRFDLQHHDVFKAQQKKWQAFLETVEKSYQQKLSQLSPDTRTWRQIRQDLRQVGENFEENILKEHFEERDINANNFEYEKRKTRINLLTLSGSFFPLQSNAILQKRFNRLTDYLGSSFNDKIKTLRHKDWTIVERFLPEIQTGRNTKFDAVLYSLKQEYNHKFNKNISENRGELELQTLHREYAQKAQALAKDAPPHYRQDRQIFSNIMQRSYQLLKQGEGSRIPRRLEQQLLLRIKISFIAAQELLHHTKNNYTDNYWLYAYSDTKWMRSLKYEQDSEQLKTWIKNCPSHVDLNLIAVEKYWNDCVFKIKQWNFHNANTSVSNIKTMIDYFLPVTKELVETSSPQHLKERKRFLDTLNKFSSDCTTMINQQDLLFSQDEIDKLSTTHDPSAYLRPIHRSSIDPDDYNDSINLLIRDEKMMPFPDMREDSALGLFSSLSPYTTVSNYQWAQPFGIIHLTSPAQGWKKVEQLVQQGVKGIDLEKAFMDVMQQAGLKADTMVKLQTQMAELQQQHKSSHDILEALQKTINTAKTNQNPWRFSNTQIGGLVSRVLPSSEPSTTFSLGTPRFYTWEPAFDPSFKRVDDQFPFKTTSGAFVIVTPGMATKADKKRGAYIFNQPQQGFSFGQGQSAFYLPSQLEQGEFKSPHRHSNPPTPVEIPAQELPDLQELRNGAIFAWVYTPKVVETQIMNQARVVQFPVQVSQRIAIGAESFRNITQRSFLPNISKGYEGRIIPLHPNNPTPSSTQSNASSSFANSPLAKGVGYYMIGRVTLSAGHEIYQGIKGQQSWGITADNLVDLAAWVVIGICFSIALPKVALVAGTGVIAHDFVTHVLPPRYPNSYLTSSERLMLQTKIFQRDYGDKAVMSFPMFGATSHMHIHTGDLSAAQQKVADAYHLPGTSSIRHIHATRTDYNLQLFTPLNNNPQQVTTFVVGYWDKNKFHALKQPIATNYQDLRIHGAVKKSNLAGQKLDDKTWHVLGITK